MFQKSLLQIVGRPVRGGQAFYGENRRSLQAIRGEGAGILSFTIDDDCTGATRPDLAARFCSRQVENIAQYIEQNHFFGDVNRSDNPIKRE